MTRTAISPRLAMSIFLNGTDGIQSLPVLHRLPVHDQLAFDNAAGLGLDLVHQLHALDNAEHLAGLHAFAYPDEGWGFGRGSLVEGSDDGGLDQDERGVVRLLALLLGRFHGGVRGGWGDSESGGSGRGGVRRRGDHDLLLRRVERTAADAHAVVATLHLQLRDPGFRRQGDQFTDFIDCHQWSSLPEVGEGCFSATSDRRRKAIVCPTSDRRQGPFRTPGGAVGPIVRTPAPGFPY